jgi:hypothetical protein
MKNLLNKTIVLISVLLITVSCNDFLKEDPRGRITNESAFSQESDLEGALYTLNRQVLMATKGMINFTPWQQGDDISTHPASNKAAIREWDVYNISDENEHLTIDTGSWYWLWKVIKAANYIINGADNSPAPQADIDMVKQQAYYWRAYAYFYLVRVWGPIPKMMSGEVDLSITPVKVSEIFELIVSDLQEAEKLPAKFTEVPYAMNGVNVLVSKGAAQASLAYVYLYMAGWPLNYGQEYYQKAAAKALEVIDASENGTYYYQLYDEYWKIHSKEYNLKNTEVLLAVYYSSITGTGDGSQSARGCINDVHEICGGGYNDVRAEIGFYCSFPDGDRKDWTYAPVTYNSTKKEAYPWWSEEIPEDQRQPYSRKSAFTSWGTAYENDEYDHYKAFNDQSNGWSTQIHQVVRLAEVYCWYAEAVGRSGQTNARAIELLNRVRNRANGSKVEDRDIYPSSMTPEQLAEAAYNEHGWEIACWYWGSIAPRYSDMQRMDRVKDHFNTRKSNPTYIIPGSDGVTLQEPFNPTGEWSQEKMFVPYPAADKRMNPGLANINKFDLIK